MFAAFYHFHFYWLLACFSLSLYQPINSRDEEVHTSSFPRTSLLLWIDLFLVASSCYHTQTKFVEFRYLYLNSSYMHLIQQKCKISCPHKNSWYLFCSTPTFDTDPLDSLPRPRDEEFMLACQCKSLAVKQIISAALCQSDIFHKTDMKYPEFTGHSFLFIHRIPS